MHVAVLSFAALPVKADEHSNVMGWLTKLDSAVLSELIGFWRVAHRDDVAFQKDAPKLYDAPEPASAL